MVDKVIRYFESDYRYPRGQNLDKKEKNANETIDIVRKRVEELNLKKVYRGTHTFHGASNAIVNRFGGMTGVGLIQEVLRLFSQGTKVCVEIALMAADAGLIPVDREIMTIGGTGQWCDTAIVLKPSFANKLFDPMNGLEIKEIVVMPRNKKLPETA